LVRDNRIDEIINLGIKVTYDAIHEIEKAGVTEKMPRDTRVTETANISKVNLEIEKDVSDVEDYLNQLEKETANMTDAELTKISPKFADKFQLFLDDLAKKYPDPELASEALKAKIGNLTRFVNQSPFMKRCLEKPRGYAGDYQMMNYIYDNEIFQARSNMGKLLNFFLFASPSTNAVRNRAKIIQGIVQQRLAQLKKLSIASIACGPAREVAETIRLVTSQVKGAKIIWTLLDQDQEALSYARKNIPRERILETNIVTAGIGDLIKKKISLGQQDIIYSLGLFDYLEDEAAVVLIKRLYSELNPGGVLLIGNFHTHNPLRALMEGATEWFLIHRMEEELLALAKAGAPNGRHFVMAEPEGINLILVTSKPLQNKN
jgi:2-polyprenyl-3-methyl-5-hydroxy-6-metoxy-1,4-benzoquinol methylase